MAKPLVPSALEKGDIIGIVAPAGRVVEQARFEKGIRILREMGFEPVFPRELWPGPGYLADTDVNRAGELMRMVASPEVKAVMAARGGYGCLRTLAHLDFSQFRKNPKPVIGFSDLTILLNQIFAQANLLCFHGPVVTSLPDCTNTALERLYYSLTGNFRKGLQVGDVEIVRGGDEVRGILVGGNLSSLMAMIGTPYDPSWKEAILFIEDINEPLYKIDRMLTQLALSGKLEGVRGLLIGDFGMDEKFDTISKLRYTEAIWTRVLELTSNTPFPVWGNCPIGHFNNNLTLPLGLPTIMDSNAATLSFY
ncbi:LD-carboxypeptidase [Desulfopila sp. IMCC35008]|uniref:S66 peptidase family protein n=1 Tax=Desulfopila sp. IMCC35008 TaxID=2653858 RepID=UPI0013D0CED0|nr:LD-carboxypeptidase [Desulfopila sp. IMCC35008]